MYGILKGCSCGLSRLEKRNWKAHFCGLCFALKEHFGQFSCLLTNHDAVFLSVLYEAQCSELLPRVTRLCPLPRFRRLEVVDPHVPSLQYAASISLLMGATKIEDHIRDGETWIRHLPKFFSRVARKWTQNARQTVRNLGFNLETIESQIRQQWHAERYSGSDFFSYSRPTEQSTAMAASHIGVLSGCVQNREFLHHIGQMFGRIMYLLDNYRDYAVDVAHNKFNALAQCFAKQEIQQRAQEIFCQTYEALKNSFNQLVLPHPELAHKLLIQQLEQVGNISLASLPEEQQRRRRQQQAANGGNGDGAESTCGCCECFEGCLPDCNIFGKGSEGGCCASGSNGGGCCPCCNCCDDCGCDCGS
jgi:hypothetical protein